MVLLELPERRVRKETEHGVLPSPPRIDFQAAVYLWALHSLSDLEPSVEWRRSLLTSIQACSIGLDDMLHRRCRSSTGTETFALLDDCSDQEQRSVESELHAWLMTA